MTPTIALQNPLIELLNVIKSIFVFNADDDADDDDFSDDAFDDDSLDFGSDDDDEDDEDDDDADDADDDDDDEDDDEDDDKDDKKSKKKLSKSEKSAIVQKKRYRDRLAKANQKIADLEKGDKKGDLTEEQQKEKAAEEFLSKKILEVLKAQKEDESSRSEAEQEEFDEEMDEVLDENEHITEKQLLKVTKELDVSPKKAMKIIARERKLSKRSKPKLPKEQRASTKITKKSDGDAPEKKTLDSIAKGIKAKYKL